MKHYSELRKSMTPEQKKKSDKMFQETQDYLKSLGAPLLCLSTHPDDIKFVRKIDHGPEPK